jgi:hypothetical protein
MYESFFILYLVLFIIRILPRELAAPTGLMRPMGDQHRRSESEGSPPGIFQDEFFQAEFFSQLYIEKQKSPLKISKNTPYFYPQIKGQFGGFTPSALRSSA